MLLFMQAQCLVITSTVAPEFAFSFRQRATYFTSSVSARVALLANAEPMRNRNWASLGGLRR
jgi:hypothetical protein